MRDVRASRGVLVCSNGYTKAALARAQQSIEIRIVTFEKAEEIGFAMVDPCPHCRGKKRRTDWLVFWDGQLPWRSVGVGQSRSLANATFAATLPSGAGTAVTRKLSLMARSTSAAANVPGSSKRTMMKPFCRTHGRWRDST